MTKGIALCEFGRIALSDIVVNRDERQRRAPDPATILESVRRRGVIVPIILDGNLLVAGERRLLASKALGLADIPYRRLSDLDPIESQIIELEENLRREDLPWKDQVQALTRIHKMHVEHEGWSISRTAESLGLSQNWLSQILSIADELEDPLVSQAQGISAAYNIISRRNQRALSDTISDILQVSQRSFQPPAQVSSMDTNSPTSSVVVPFQSNQIIPSEESILQEDFIQWAETYTGPSFNFIHCDFPYGINYNSGPMSGAKAWTTYKDSPDVYWALCAALCGNLRRIMSTSAHMIFWFSMEYYCETLEFFRKEAPSLTFQPHPLIWVKSDNVGILPDPKRGPRRIYETALIASREDRQIIRAVSNAYSSPTDKAHHPSTKPEPMLHNFFQMFVDEHTNMLDPTCGSASSLRAAERLGCKNVLGLESSPEHCANARSAMKSFRTLRAISKS